MLIINNFISKLYFTKRSIYPRGGVILFANESKLLGISLVKQVDIDNTRVDYYQDDKLSIFQQAITELQEYLAGTRKTFSRFYELSGTEFQLRVWKATNDIPYGSTATYQDIAKKIANPKAFRAVGAALSRNPLLFVIPCHRVIAKNNNLCGYAGGLPLKNSLLKHEGLNNSVDNII